jgi:hypothetical protein
MRIRSILFAAVACSFAAQANADTVIFADNFNTENGGIANSSTLNYNSFDNWTVSGGTVDLIGNGYFDFYPGNGLYVDLDGSSGNAGRMATGNLGLVAGNTYVVMFSLGGNARGGSDTAILDVTVGNFNESFTLASSDPLTVYTRTFVANGDGVLSFEGVGGNNIGLILDNVQVTLVPLPNGVALGAFGLGVTGFFARRRTAARRRLA